MINTLAPNNANNASLTPGSLSYFVHESSYVDDGDQAKIGSGTSIWHFSHILSGAVLGENCNLGQNVSIAGGVIIGNNVKIQNNVSVYDGTIIEDDVFLGPSCVLTNVSNPRSQVSRKSIYEKTLIKKGATIGANSTIVCGVSIGRYALISAGAVVTKDVPDYALMIGVPAEQSGWISRHGHKLTKPDKDGIYTCPESKLKYCVNDRNKMHCLDLNEDSALPEGLAKGKHEYRFFKNKS